jgi:hypothetical protein
MTFNTRKFTLPGARVGLWPTHDLPKANHDSRDMICRRQSTFRLRQIMNCEIRHALGKGWLMNNIILLACLSMSNIIITL